MINLLDLLVYLENSPMGSIQIRNMRTKHFVLNSNELMLIDFEGLEAGEPPCRTPKAHITAVYKKGDRKSLENYRPISLTSVVCKIMKSFIRDHIVKFMEGYDLFNCNQHGHSCITQLLEVIESWTEILDEVSSVDTINLDFKKRSIRSRTRDK